MLVKTLDNIIQKLVLIDAIQRLGVEYHFENEIKTSIQNIFDESEQNKNEDDVDLYVVALRFRLVRQQRHYMSSEEFVAKETFQWILNESLVLPASSRINRLKDDIIGHEHEQQREYEASFVACYMKEYGASKQDAYTEI
ncbi:Beta-caryophyllene synthase [Capsicum chinense]|nr:Beta-caryophyllene synthase [Capsicum chinense]